MENTFKRLLALMLFAALLPLFAAASGPGPFAGFEGSWLQTNAQGDAWELDLRPDGTGIMKNAQQYIPISWEAEVMLGEMVVVTLEDLEGSYFEVLWYIDGVLEGEDQRNFERPQPDILFEEEYEAAIPGEIADFDGVWELTGGIISIKEPPMTMTFSAEDISGMSGGQMPSPIYVGIKNGKLMGRTKEGVYMADPGLVSTYTGKAIFATRAGIPSGVAGYYYVSPGVLHLTGPNPDPDVIESCIFTLNLTDLEMIPEGTDNSWALIPEGP